MESNMSTQSPRPVPSDLLTGQIIQAAMKVHTMLGPGLLESIYETCLEKEIANRMLDVKRQVGVPIIYEGVKLEGGFRIDLLVEGSVVVEVKAVEAMHPLHWAQLYSYLKLSDHRLGLLINFNVEHLKDGIKRIAN
jgi:GxxExxY protein